MIGSIVRDISGTYNHRTGVWRPTIELHGRIGVVINENLDWDWEGFEEISYLIHWIDSGREDWLDYCEHSGFGSDYMEVAC